MASWHGWDYDGVQWSMVRHALPSMADFDNIMGMPWWAVFTL